DRSAGIGDFDGDGDVDLAIGCRAQTGFSLPSEVFIVDATTGDEVFRFAHPTEVDFGHLPGPAGDTNGDGYADILISDGDGTMSLFLGPTGTLAGTFQGPSEILTAGWTVGDIDGDGGDDFLISWGQAGYCDVHSGRTGSLLGTFCVLPPGGCFGQYGSFVAPLGDTNGDDVPDFALSARNVILPEGEGGVGAAQIISGADLSILHTIHGRPRSGFDFFGGMVGGGHDANGDGVNDFVSAAVSTSYSSGSLVSGRTGQILYQVRSEYEGGSLPMPAFYGVVGGQTLPDINGDGYADWAVGAPFANFGGFSSGRVIVLSGGPGDAEVICQAADHSGGERARLHLYGAITEFSRGLEIRIRGGLPGETAAILFGDETPPVALGSALLCVDPSSTRHYGGILALDASGDVTRSVDWGRGVISSGPRAWVAGSTWTIQAFFRDPGSSSGLQTTDAIRVQFNG
ncbi:MAG: integrin alpha, partial [Planctomycetota bacterium]